ncbi:protein translocase subunit SecD [Nocardioides sp. Y6]|uniref:Multifunctional fusion protein n=1 Tax=Nocardioides malaquae TaxID=2773426 RepID=A0ABR9RUR2_9ACTN|nr:protein translocase subunit SecD [Nocardioides malaquae]MBE7325299.1 protein translocase subunit SecD [Nocardioides malaquae]
MSRAAWIRFVLVLGLLAGCAAIALNMKPTLGLDLRGGVSVTLQTYDSPNGTVANAENTDRTKAVLEQRVNALGLSEPNIVRSGENRIIVELPGVKDADEAAEQLGQTAQLTVHAVTAGGLTAEEPGQTPEPSEEGNLVMEDPDVPDTFVELAPAVLEGEDISGASSGQREGSTTWVVNVDFSRQGSAAFSELSAAAACAQGDQNRIAIVLDDRIISAPGVNVSCGSSISGSTEISGDFTVDEANELAALIEGGSLPLEVKAIESRMMGPTLGEKAIDASIWAGIIGITLTGIFIVAVYRFVGLMATVALASYALLSYAMLIALGSTLTLPGLAGFVLAIGMAIDANVLVFERAREEYAAYPSAGLRRALQVGFNKAWTAIIDSNVTTLLAAALLFFLGSGPIKGFGVTLTIGVVASMISALIIARVLTELGVANKTIARHPAVTGIGDIGRVRKWLERKDPDLMKRRKTWLVVSAAATVLAIAGIAVNGLNLGVEFSGGRVLEYSTQKTLTADDARDALSDVDVPIASVQETDGDKILVRTGVIDGDEAAEINAAIESAGEGATLERDEKISASFGQELRNKALIAFGVAFLAQLAYLAVRFKWTFGVSAVVAMVHDVLIVVGLFAWLGKPIDGIFLAAAMTIIGLSVNDTVVVFDRIRERWRGSQPGETFMAMANKAAVETLPRTVNTGLGTMFILAALAIIGGDSLRDFAIALLVGLLVGTYSSVFTATPLVSYFQQKWPMAKELPTKAKYEADESGAVV